MVVITVVMVMVLVIHVVVVVVAVVRVVAVVVFASCRQKAGQAANKLLGADTCPS